MGRQYGNRDWASRAGERGMADKKGGMERPSNTSEKENKKPKMQ